MAVQAKATIQVRCLLEFNWMRSRTRVGQMIEAPPFVAHSMAARGRVSYLREADKVVRTLATGGVVSHKLE